ncbi:MAG: hypothetical protein N2Z59_09415 [Alteraurantiacibacter sp.]|nr:hypothetical protein [Alteraurantiacibacter sp.]
MPCLILAACSPEAENSRDAAHTPVFGSAEAASRLVLEPLGSADLAQLRLEGDMGCFFAENPADDPLLVARGKVKAPQSVAQAAIRYAGTVHSGDVQETGGFEALLGGASLSTAALAVTVRPEQGDVGTPSGQMVPRTAQLTVTQAGHPDTVITGFWTCLP